MCRLRCKLVVVQHHTSGFCTQHLTSELEPGCVTLRWLWIFSHRNMNIVENNTVYEHRTLTSAVFLISYDIIYLTA